jgi:hypothetical protein
MAHALGARRDAIVQMRGQPALSCVKSANVASILTQLRMSAKLQFYSSRALMLQDKYLILTGSKWNAKVVRATRDGTMQHQLRCDAGRWA